MASSSSSRATKLQKIDSLRRSCPYVSQAALEALLKKVKEEGVPEVSHSKAMKEATRHYLSSMDAYGKLLMQVQVVTVDGNTKPIWIANALSLLAGAYRQGGAWAAMLQRVHGQRPSSYTTPWRLLLYADEVVPGNSLAHRQERKTHAIYASFAEFHNLLSCEDAWFIVAMLRSPEVADIQASIGQVFAKILESIFCSPVADPRTGLCLPHLSDSAQDLKLFFTMGGWLQDGLSMKLTFPQKETLETNSACCATILEPCPWTLIPVKFQRKTSWGPQCPNWLHVSWPQTEKFWMPSKHARPRLPP